MRPRILFISHEAGEGIGGSTYSLCHLVKSVNHCIDYTVVSNPGDAIEYLNSNGINCDVIKLPIRLHVWYKEKSRHKIIERLLRILYNYSLNLIAALYISYKYKNKIDIVHSNSAVLDIGFLIAKFLNAKHIWHLREFMNLDHDMEPLLGWKRMYRLCREDSVICISNAIAQHYKIEDKTSVVYDAVCNREDKQLIVEKDKYFLYAGGKKIKKGILDCIRVFNEFSFKYPEYKLYITGDLSCISDYSIQSAIGNNENIILLGYRKDLRSLMHKATAYLMCSHNEGLGRVTVEAIFAGCPIIGYEGGATPEIIKDGVTGWLYKTDEQFELALEDVVNNPREGCKRTMYAQSFALNNFTSEFYEKKIMELYNKCIKSK